MRVKQQGASIITCAAALAVVAAHWCCPRNEHRCCPRQGAGQPRQVRRL